MPPLPQQNDDPSATDLPVNGTIDSVSQSTVDYLKKRAGKIILWMVVLEGLFILGKPENVAFYATPLAIPVFWYFFAQSKVQNEFMQQFAQANGYTYSKTGNLGVGYLFERGHSRVVTDQAIGTYNGYSIQLYLYSYIVGYGKGAHTYSHTVFALGLKTPMPDIVLSAKGSLWVGEAPVVPASVPIVNLEGDFGKYFTLHVPKGYEIEALEVFTPDVMAKLMEKAQGLNIEISQNWLYVYSDGIVGTKEKLYKLYELARYMTDELGPVLAMMKPSLEATEEVKEGR